MNDQEGIELIDIDLEENFLPEVKQNDKGNFINSEKLPLNQKSIYNIESQNKKGIGFICQIPDPDNKGNIKVLFSCYHLIEIEHENKISMSSDGEKAKEKIINLNDGRRYWWDEELDYVCIEILPKDNISNYLCVFQDIKDEKYKNKYIEKQLLYASNTKEISAGNGKLLSFEHLIYNFDTECGWSGSPVFLNLDNKVIGIHLAGYEKNKYNKCINIGVPIKTVLKHIKKLGNNNEKELYLFYKNENDFYKNENDFYKNENDFYKNENDKNNKRIKIYNASIITIILVILLFFVFTIYKYKELKAIIEERDKEIIKLNKTIKEKDIEIIKLNKTIEERVNEMIKLNKTIKEKDNEIIKLNKAIEEKDNEIKEKIKLNLEEQYKNDEFIKEKDKKIEKFEAIFTKKNFNDEKNIPYIIKDHLYKINKEYQYIIEEEGSYRICVFGAKPEKGGIGGKQCADHYFKKGSEIIFNCEGRNQGGEGGKGCGLFKSGNGNNGGGLSMAKYDDEFFIVGGGGGGDSEDNKKGGDYQKDGEGENGGRCGKKLQNHSKYEINSLKGANGKKNGDSGMNCGGGGGNGYPPGDGGDYGNSGGGGGGGSCFCRADNCFACELNYKNNTGYEIYKKISI